MKHISDQFRVTLKVSTHGTEGWIAMSNNFSSAPLNTMLICVLTLLITDLAPVALAEESGQVENIILESPIIIENLPPLMCGSNIVRYLKEQYSVEINRPARNMVGGFLMVPIWISMEWMIGFKGNYRNGFRISYLDYWRGWKIHNSNSC